jgi:hypothetical protein
LYSYDCDKTQPCDPEILVDDGVLAGGRRSSFTGIRVPIQVWCDDTSKTTKIRTGDETKKVKFGDVVHWVVVGDHSANDTITVTFGSADEQMKVCTDGDPITPTHDCTVKPSPMAAEYKVNVTPCTTAGAGKLEP